MGKKPKIVAIIQARMAASRLPGKVLLEIGDRPMLGWVLERTHRAETLDAVVVATTDDPSDDPVAEYCEAQGYPVYRGSQFDVLDRYYQAAMQYQADVVVRITADCPLIDPQIIDQTILALFGEEVEAWTPHFDFTANRLPPPWGRTYPIGLDVEVCTMDALTTAWQETTQKHHREHVMPYLYENTERFRVKVIHNQTDEGAQRWTVDTPEDLALVREVITHFEGDDFAWLDILALFQSHPELAKINAGVQHKTVTDVDTRIG